MNNDPGTGGRGCIRRAVVSATAVALVLAPQPAGANPAILFVDAGSGGALMPRSTEEVRIVSERLEFSEATELVESENRAGDELALPWHVRADYVLENLTAERVELDIGFPIAGHRGEWDQNAGVAGVVGPRDWWGGERGIEPFKETFHVRLDGNEIRSRPVSNPCPAEPSGETADAGEATAATGAASACYPDLFVFRLAIEASAQASLIVEYDQDPSLCCDSEGGDADVYGWANYILETGALWAGTIGRLDIIYRFALPPPRGALVFDRLVGPGLPSEGPWRLRTDEGAPRGFSAEAHLVAAPEGVMDLWDPPVRFHYAFACRDGRIVLRLKATDFEPGGNVSLGVQNVDSRRESLAHGSGYREPERAPCAARVTTRSDDGRPAAWELFDPSVGRYGDEVTVNELPAEWSCAFIDDRGPEYTYDCCCAAAAGTGHWNPDCDKPGGAGGKGCAAGAGSVVPSPRDSPSDAGTAEAGEPDALDAEAPQDAAAGLVTPEAAATVADAWPKIPADTTTPQSGSGSGAVPTPPVVTVPVAADASIAPASAPAKKGCGCRAVGAEETAPSGLAALGVLLFATLRRRRPR
jgi:MYXO-CTERM domain-containing protein